MINIIVTVLTASKIYSWSWRRNIKTEFVARSRTVAVDTSCNSFVLASKWLMGHWNWVWCGMCNIRVIKYDKFCFVFIFVIVQLSIKSNSRWFCGCICNWPQPQHNIRCICNNEKYRISHLLSTAHIPIVFIYVYYYHHQPRIYQWQSICGFRVCIDTYLEFQVTIHNQINVYTRKKGNG